MRRSSAYVGLALASFSLASLGFATYDQLHPDPNDQSQNGYPSSSGSSFWIHHPISGGSGWSSSTSSHSSPSHSSTSRGGFGSHGSHGGS